MNSFKRNMSILFFATLSQLLAACGGGGSSDAGIAVPTAPATPASISAANAELVSADVLGTVGIIEGFMLVGDLLPAVQVDTAGTEFSYPGFFVQQLRRLPEMDMSSNDIIVTGAVIPPAREPCDNAGGTMTISGDVAVVIPEWIPNVDDQITIKYEDCELAGIVLNGTMSMIITDLEGDFVNEIPPYTLGVNVVLTVFSVEAGGPAVYADGDISMLLVEEASGDETLKFLGNSITTWDGGEVDTLTDFDYYTTWNQYTTVYSLDMIGTLASTVIGGSVIFESTVPFTGADNIPPNGDPNGGELWITTTADASQSLTTAQSDGINVEIKVDADGDGNYDEPSIWTTWTELECLLNPEPEACL